mmetsp:Transcript_50551/g.110330  ORF Transcript_50551/g.110330 Transcript_50551/m.110330 type:complete len:401 (+) Transcript_50551:48-1250(+)
MELPKNGATRRHRNGRAESPKPVTEDKPATEPTLGLDLGKAASKEPERPERRGPPAKGGMVVKETCAPNFLGVPLKWLSLMALAFQTPWQVFAFKFALSGGTSYLNSAVVLFAEILKTLLSVLLVMHEQGSLEGAARVLKVSFTSELPETLKVSIPALAYVIQNNLLFYSLVTLSAAVQQVTYQLKILAAALLSVLMLGKELDRTKWASLTILVIGVALVQFPRADGSAAPLETPGGINGASVRGFLAVLMACFMSGFAGVYVEKILKRSSSIWLRNAQLGVFGSCQALAGAFMTDGSAILAGGFLQGFSWRVVMLVFTLAWSGLLVAMVLKYADNILRQFATALSLIITSALSACILRDFQPDGLFFLGALLAVSAAFMYNLGLPDWLVGLHVARTKTK